MSQVSLLSLEGIESLWRDLLAALGRPDLPPGAEPALAGVLERLGTRLGGLVYEQRRRHRLIIHMPDHGPLRRLAGPLAQAGTVEVDALTDPLGRSVHGYLRQVRSLRERRRAAEDGSPGLELVFSAEDERWFGGEPAPPPRREASRPVVPTGWRVRGSVLLVAGMAAVDLAATIGLLFALLVCASLSAILPLAGAHYLNFLHVRATVVDAVRASRSESLADLQGLPDGELFIGYVSRETASRIWTQAGSSCASPGRGERRGNPYSASLPLDIDSRRPFARVPLSPTPEGT